jgi:hypothetical protein
MVSCVRQTATSSVAFGSRLAAVAAQSSSVVAADIAIRTLQDMMPPAQFRPMPTVELESVAPGLLLPPVRARSCVAAAQAGGPFDLGDRVLSLREGGDGPPFGLRGTVSTAIPLPIQDVACLLREAPWCLRLTGARTHQQYPT